MSKYQVKKINTVAVHGNAYNVDRGEVWGWSTCAVFNSYESAKEFADNKNCELPEYKNLLPHDKTNIDNFTDLFLNDDKYIKYRRYFVGNPPVDKISLALEKDGIFVLKK